MRETISAVLVVKNEEHQIERVLKTLDWVDEIVVVDDQSTDRTREIAGRYTPKILPFHLSNSLAEGSEGRGMGEKAATSDWILQMDADEEVTEKFKQECLKVLATISQDYDGFKFYRKNFFLEHPMKWGGWSSLIFRMHRRGKVTYHEKLHLGMQVQGKIGHIDAEINHYPFCSVAQFVERHNRYSTVVAEEDMKNKYGLVSLKKVKYNLTIRPIKIFWKIYIKKKGYRDGMVGLIFSVLFSFQHFLEWAKYWEKYKDQLPPK